MATIGDVAKLAGVSTTLVSRYLNQVKGVGPASKEKIEAAIRELDYVPDESARMLVRRRGSSAAAPAMVQEGEHHAPILTIAMVCEDADPQLVSALYLGAKRAVWEDESRRAYHLVFLQILPGNDRTEDEQDTFSYVVRSCRGMLCVGNASAALAKQLKETGIPVVLGIPETGSRMLVRGSADVREAADKLESAGKEMLCELYEKIRANDSTLSDYFLPCALSVTEDNGERSPIGRGLQSHLL